MSSRIFSDEFLDDVDFEDNDANQKVDLVNKDEDYNSTDLEHLSGLASIDEYEEHLVKEAYQRLNILKIVEKNLEGGWSERNITKVLNDALDQGLINSTPSWRTVNRWKKRFYENKSVVSLINGNKKKRKKGGSGFDSLAWEAVTKKYLTKERPSISATYRYYVDLVEVSNKSVVEGIIKPISPRWFYKLVNDLPPYEVACKRFGKRYADKYFRKIGKFKKVDRVMERVEIDHTPLDLILLDDTLEQPLGRPYLTMLVDSYSRCIVGLHLGYREPGYDAVRKAMLNACLSKKHIKQKYPAIKKDWPCEGKIENLVVDNGAEFWSESLELFCQALGTNVEYNPVAKPWKKPLVERVFSTYKSGLIDQIPGKTFSNVQQLKDYNPKKDAILPFSLFVELLYVWVVDIYNYTPSSRETNIPILAWELGAKELPPVKYTGLEEQRFILESLPATRRRLRNVGVVLDHITYCSDELVEFRKNTPPSNGEKYVELMIKRDPSDVSKIYVFLPDCQEYVLVPAVDPESELQGVSLFEHQTYTKFTRLFNRSRVDRLGLAEARQYIEERTQEYIEAAANSKSKNSARTLGGISRLAKLNDVSSSGNSSVVREEAKARMASTQSKVSNENDTHKALDSEVLEDWGDWADDLEPY
ncbi:MAG: transposase [Marinospirillum sp.]|uniref:Mu transposase C-terminal domain-containing protein n=1 Tax=Marinospirillum sp. TaxID=2183934 RepID=UPI001A09F622|nr:Mu transposase C-terminal domain-containing protein [Marinospirillum sp.]MBE0507494.1 transposase [Marinospirillum sp.]